MSPDAIHGGLPLIDTFKTNINRFCPAKMKQPKCAVQRYRSYDGQCNNVENPTWGAVDAPFRRLIPPAYADGNVNMIEFNGSANQIKVWLFTTSK